jgi:hypothetical protein
MKKIVWLLSFIPSLAMAQNIYTVSNAPGTSANFKTLQGAHDSVAAGSILYVMPSSYSYGDPVFSKKLTIYGTGYFLGQNLEPYTQANTAPVLVNSITFRAGSDNSYVEGLQLAFQAQQNTNRVALDTVANVTISRCLLVSSTYGAFGGYHSFFFLNGANNCLIKQCYIQNINGATVPPVIRYQYPNLPNFSGIQFVNNIFDWQGVGGNGFNTGPDGASGFQAGGTTNASFTNNTFYIDCKDARFGNLSYTNNIFVNDIPSYVITDPTTLYFGTALYNVTNEPLMFPTPGNNFHGANTDSMFIGSLSGYHSTDQKWKTRDTSFVNTFGQGGAACGAYGGTNPYRLSGIPNLPFIYNLTVPSQATAPGTIAVHIKANASN